MYATWLDHYVAVLAQRQHGVFSRAQVLAEGGTDDMIRTRLAAGVWIRLTGGVYALRSAPATFQRQLKAAELSVPGAVVSGRAAAALHGFSGFGPCRPEIVVPPGSNHRVGIARVRESVPDRICRVDGIAAVSAAQALFDVAGSVSGDRLARALDDREAGMPGFLDDVRDRYVTVARSRRPGIGKIRSLLAVRGGGYVPPASELERRAIALLASHPGIPEPARQQPFPWRPSDPERVDLVIAAWRLIIELDGRRWHTRVADFDRDLARDNDVVIHGWRPLRFSWIHVTRQPQEVITTILAAGSLAA